MFWDSCGQVDFRFLNALLDVLVHLVRCVEKFSILGAFLSYFKHFPRRWSLVENSRLAFLSKLFLAGGTYYSFAG